MIVYVPLAPQPQFMMTIEPGMVNKLQVHGLISFEDIFFWCLFLDLNLITHHSTIGVISRRVTKLGPLTLMIKIATYGSSITSLCEVRVPVKYVCVLFSS